MNGKKFWATTPTAQNSLDLVLGSVSDLPLKYWRENFFFLGARDEELLGLTSGCFPATTTAAKTHPVFSLHHLPDNVGFTACPCTSRIPFNSIRYRYIKKGCRLQHTGYCMDRNSYLVEAFKLNIPASMAGKLRFKGEVPNEWVKAS